MIEGKTRFADRPITDTFPGAVHGSSCPICLMLRVVHGPSDGWRCPACTGKAASHRFSPNGARRGFLWTYTSSGEARICAEGIIIDSPPSRKAK